MRSEEILSVRWEQYEKNPVINPPFPSPIIADPTFLLPESTGDGKWHLFAHSLIGIHHFISSDGIVWKRLKGMVSFKSMRPFVFKEGDEYYLFYEKISNLFPYHSHLELRESSNLFEWSKPAVILKPSLTWHKDGSKYGAVSNPCLVKEGDAYRLYYSAGLVYLKDCKFYEPKYIGVANSPKINQEYEILPHPIISPSIDDMYSNLGAGSMKVIKTDDGYVGFQNGIYWDYRKNHSGSAIRILASLNGYEWNLFRDEPIIKPDKGWKKTHVYALDVKRVGNKFYLYFNARNGWFFGKEHIGLAFGLR